MKSEQGRMDLIARMTLDEKAVLCTGASSFMDMLNDMPLVSVLMFQQATLPVHPEVMVEQLLSQVHGRA